MSKFGRVEEALADEDEAGLTELDELELRNPDPDAPLPMPVVAKGEIGWGFTEGCKQCC